MMYGDPQQHQQQQHQQQQHQQQHQQHQHQQQHQQQQQQHHQQPPGGGGDHFHRGPPLQQPPGPPMMRQPSASSTTLNPGDYHHPSANPPYEAHGDSFTAKRMSSVPSSEDEGEIERELAEVTFGDLQKARSDGSHLVYRKDNQEKKTGRANKNRPMEVSAKKPVSRFREVVQAPKRVVRDPRFESLCGQLDVEGFRKRYDFLFENNLPAEKEELKKQLKKTNDPNVVDGLKKRASWIDKQLKLESSSKSSDAAILAQYKKKEKEAAKHGKRPYYLKNSEIRKQKLIEKYNNLKASGKLESFIEKRRKKNASKDHKYMPYRRPADSEQ